MELRGLHDLSADQPRLAGQWTEGFTGQDDLPSYITG